MAAYTFTEYQAMALHAAARSTVDTGNSTLIIVNQAIQEVVNAHPWSWRMKNTTLNFVAAQAYVNLPSDFSELVYLQGGASSRIKMVPTSLNVIYKGRQNIATVIAALNFLYAISAVTQANVSSDVTWRLELYPTPPSSVTDAMQIQYLKRVPDLASAGDHVDAPPQFQSLFMDMVRGVARKYELGINDELQDARARVEQFKQRDAMVQPIVGTLRGAVQPMATNQGFMDDPYANYPDVPVTI